MDRRTKIICTLGPACSDEKTIRQLIEAGMDVARLNFSHGTHEDHRRTIENVRSAADKVGRVVPILQDLQGPKIRLGEVKEGSVLVDEGERLTLTAAEIPESNGERVHVSYPTLADDVDEGGRILLDDGLLELKVTNVRRDEREVDTEVVVGGPLRSNKGVNLPDIRNSTPSMTEKDRRDLEFGLSMNVDMVALSFVRNKDDLTELVERVRESGKMIGVVAKIEKPEAVREIDEIIDVCDGIMVARGDMGIEMPMSQVPGVQKMLIQRSLAAARPVITATQMLESMIENPRPTRAEASDVANAVLDGSDAVMLSGETAVGNHPVRVVETMGRIIEEAEKQQPHYSRETESEWVSEEEAHEVTEAVSFTACHLAEQVGAAAIACLTSSGATARAIARHRPSMPLYAFTDNERVVGQLAFTWGTKGFPIPFQRDTDQGVRLVHETLVNEGLVGSGDLIVITAGMPLPEKGSTNMMHVSEVE